MGFVISRKHSRRCALGFFALDGKAASRGSISEPGVRAPLPCATARTGEARTGRLGHIPPHSADVAISRVVEFQTCNPLVTRAPKRRSGDCDFNRPENAKTAE